MKSQKNEISKKKKIKSQKQSNLKKNELSQKKVTSQEKPHFLKESIPKDLETRETIKQNKYLKKYWRNK